MAECRDRAQHGDVICEDGLLWQLSYSEMGPPDQRQCIGECPTCHCKKCGGTGWLDGKDFPDGSSSTCRPCPACSRKRNYSY